MKDYDMSVLYHPDKINVVADTLIHTTMGSVYHVEEGKKDLVKDVHRLACLGVRLKYSPNSGFMVHNNSESSLMVVVKSKKHLDPLLLVLKELKESVLIKFNELFSQGGMVYLGTKVDCVCRKYRNILFICVPPKCIVILKRFIGGMV